MAGWYRMHRGWMDDPSFAGEPYSRRTAWIWLIEHAAWEEHFQWFNGRRIKVDRGQLITSERTLSEIWKWDRQRVRTFLKHLETDEKLTREIDQQATKLTLCNYDKYQSEQPTEEPVEQPRANPELTQGKPTTEEEKEVKKGKKKEEESARFAFFGRTIRLTANDLDRWRKTYHAIADLDAELLSIDAWFQMQDEAAQKQWFWRAQSMLNRKHQEILTDDRREEPSPDAWLGA